jgi:hypothetical protein
MGGTLVFLCIMSIAWIHCGSDGFTTANTDDGGNDGSDGSTCDPSKDPSCVSDGSGIFVNGAHGNDTNAGTKEAPVKTIGAALAKASSSKNAIYVCADSYAEHVKITSAVNLYGGFACADWSYAATNKPKIAPSEAGYALDVENVSSAIAITDLEFDSIDAVKPGDSSIAIFVASSTNVTLHRVTATAGNGVAGSDPINADADAGAAPTGNSATSDLGAGPCTNACGAETSTGGGGGTGAITPATPSNGADGGPPIPPNDGHGVGGVFSIGCGPGQPGNNGPSADSDAGAPTSGKLTSSGWASASANAGASGGVGQGGGGGSGGAHATASNNGGGGGGGCGGCGGAGGAAGNSGGSSFAILVFQSTLTLDTCTLTAGNGGDGKAGGSGQAGQTGGFPGNPAQAGVGCTGGTGGNGGAGAGGGGGAGGNAIAIGYVGTKPTVIGGMQQEGTAGAPGAGGAGGASNNGLAGAAGTKADVQELP